MLTCALKDELINELKQYSLRPLIFETVDLITYDNT